jgi:hypothetical protein
MVKGKRFLSILATAIILAMMIMAIPVIPASAETGSEHINVLPSSGAVGDEDIEVEGSSFEIEDKVYLFFSNEEADEGDDVGDLDSYAELFSMTTDSVGYFSGNFDVPDELDDGSEDIDVTGGQYYIYASYDSDGDDIVAIDEFNVLGVSISPDEGPVGTKVEVTGSGFEDNEDITIEFGSTDVDIEDGDDETDNDGEFTSYFLVPESTAGDHTITVDVNGDEAEAEFTVEPQITIDPEEGKVNDRVMVSGTGFGYRDDIIITFDGDEVGGDETDSSGSFEAPINVPELGSGTFEVEAEDESDNSASANFTISTEVNISPTTTVNSPGYVGMEITISGSGFRPNYEITITYESTPVVVATPESGADGSFTATFKVPASKGGEHTITATDGTSTMSVDFYMESTPPDTPPPLLPYMDDKADSQAYFDWEDVTTDIDGQPEQSLPITYELQIATNENFTSPLVNKKGITTSEYTLTEDEALESTSDEIPTYYWRVRAVDAASNTSDWTGAGRFTVGFSFNFDMSGWLLYVLIGIGAVILFFVGFWLGRRGGGGEYY